MNVVPYECESLHDSIWQYVPFTFLKIAIFDVFQFGASEVPEELNTMLRKTRTSQLCLKFEERIQARKVLQASPSIRDALFISTNYRYTEPRIRLRSAISQAWRFEVQWRYPL